MLPNKSVELLVTHMLLFSHKKRTDFSKILSAFYHTCLHITVGGENRQIKTNPHKNDNYYVNREDSPDFNNYLGSSLRKGGKWKSCSFYYLAAQW